jgi:cell division septal protein FtsQ
VPVNQGITVIPLKNIIIRGASMLFLFLIIASQGFGQKDYKLRKISIEGNKTLKNAEIKANMNSKAKTLTGKLKFWVRAPRFSGKVLD